MKLQQTIIPKLENVQVLVATSAGSDSMALLDLLYQHRVIVHACYIDHLQRPTETPKEIACLQAYCKERGIPFLAVPIEWAHYEKNENKQAFFRAERYRILVEEAKKKGIKYIATAHHQDDQSETLLMRLVKNYDIASLNGISESRHLDGCEIIRPLLQVSKQALLTYCLERAIPFCHDSSNDTPDYFRNLLRQVVMPVFKQENDKFSATFNEKIADLTSLYTDIYETKKIIVRQTIVIQNGAIELEKLKQLLQNEPTAVQKIIIEIVLRDALKYKKTLTHLQIKRILLAIITDEPKFKLTLANQTTCCLQYNQLFLLTNKQTILANEQLKKQRLTIGRCQYGSYHFTCSLNDIENASIRITKDCFEQGVYLQMPTSDLHLQLKNGKKKLNRLYIDEKILPNRRYQTPILVTSADEVIIDFLTQKIAEPFLNKNMSQLATEWVYITINSEE